MTLRSVLHVAQRFFVAAGFILLGYSGGTFAYAGLYQFYQSWKFEEQKLDLSVLAKPGMERRTANLREGDLVGKLEIPRIGISVMVLAGVEDDILRVAAGHVPGTSLPGAGGNAAIAAHRDTFFRKLEGIELNDRIQVSTVNGTYEYIVASTEIVNPEDTWVLESQGYPELTLITCFPFSFIGSAPDRFIVHARLAN